MAIAAMANVTQFEKRELLALQRKFNDFAQREGNPHTITRSEFREALESVGVTESDTEILDRLFTMFDKTGDDQVNFREFVVGISPLITGKYSCHGERTEIGIVLCFRFWWCLLWSAFSVAWWELKFTSLLEIGTSHGSRSNAPPPSPPPRNPLDRGRAQQAQFLV